MKKTIVLIAIILSCFVSVKTYRFISKQITSKYYNNGINHIIQGKEWLFYHADLFYVLNQWSKLRQDIEIKKIDQSFKDNNIRLIVVPLPTVIDVYPEKLTGLPLKNVCKEKSKLIKSLKASNVEVIDFLPDLLKLKKDKPIFYPNETHLTNDASNLVASRISIILNQYKLQQKRYEEIDTIITDFIPNLAYRIGSKKTQTITLTKIKGYSDTVFSDITLVGDSSLWYYGDYSANLTAKIGCKLNRPLVSKSSTDLKRHAKILKKISTKNNTKVVVWIFTSRDLCYSFLN